MLAARRSLSLPSQVCWLSGVSPAHAAKPSPRGPGAHRTVDRADNRGPEGEPEWILSVDALDPDGVIWELAVRWGDGTMSWASTFCVQGGDPGTPAHLEIPTTYQASGHYRIQVEATSVPGCFVGPGGEQTSRPVTKMFTVTT